MNRPTIKTFLPEDFAPKDVARMFHENPELKQYIHALDAYIDHLEENQGKIEVMTISPSEKMRIDIIPHSYMEKGIGKLFIHPNDYPQSLKPKTEIDLVEIETDLGKINVLKDPSLGPDEVRIGALELFNPISGMEYCNSCMRKVPKGYCNSFNCRGYYKTTDQP